MLTYIARRLLLLVPMALGMVIVTFGLLLLVPGDPAAVLLGPGPCAIFVLQALLAIRLLEAVNYFEHWGLERTTRRVADDDFHCLCLVHPRRARAANGNSWPDRSSMPKKAL